MSSNNSVYSKKAIAARFIAMIIFLIVFYFALSPLFKSSPTENLQCQITVEYEKGKISPSSNFTKLYSAHDTIKTQVGEFQILFFKENKYVRIKPYIDVYDAESNEKYSYIELRIGVPLKIKSGEQILILKLDKIELKNE